MSVFDKCDGGVLKVPTSCDANIAVIKVDDFISTVPLTGFTLELSTNHQFLHSLDEFIYVFAFGDRVGELTMSGLTFVGGCANSKEGTPASVYEFYMQKRLAINLRPAKITIGGSNQTLLGFLTGLRMEMPNPSLPVIQWVLRYNVVVDSSRSS